jgi:hypothetical protein
MTKIARPTSGKEILMSPLLRLSDDDGIDDDDDACNMLMILILFLSTLMLVVLSRVATQSSVATLSFTPS